MFKNIWQSLKTGVVTTAYPRSAAAVSNRARGKPEIDWANWTDARPAAAVCPTGAIECGDGAAAPVLDLGKCVFCGLCAEADKAIRMTNQCELAAVARESLRLRAPRQQDHDRQPTVAGAESIEDAGERLRTRIRSVLGRSLHIREVDAGSCNGCEVEIHGLNSPVYDLERFGIHFVASPRHADGIHVTGPITRNMRAALLATYEAVPEPRVVIASGSCPISGGPFHGSGEIVAPLDSLLPVDLYIPGCPPHPMTTLHALLAFFKR